MNEPSDEERRTCCEKQDCIPDFDTGEKLPFSELCAFSYTLRLALWRENQFPFR